MTKRRWLVPLVTIIAVLGLCAGIIAADDQPLLSRGPRQHWLAAASDGTGGVIVAWVEDTSLYAQRVDNSGERQWDENLLISETCSLFHQPMIADGNGGAIISWEDDSTIYDNPLYSGYTEPVPFFIRKITGDGRLTWDEKPVSAGRRLEIVPDGSGGVILAWNRFEKELEVQYQDHLYVQRIDGNGDYLWGEEGMSMVASSRYAVTGEPGDPDAATSQKLPSYRGNHYLAEDGSGGAFLAWSDKHSQSVFKMYLQHLDGNGDFSYKPPLYVTDGVVFRMEYDGKDGVTFTAAGSVRLTGDATHYLNLTEIHVSADRTMKKQETKTYQEKLRDSLGNSFLLTKVEVTRLGDGFSLISKLDPDGAVLWEEKAGFADDGKKHIGTGYLPDERGGLYAVHDTYVSSMASCDIRAGKLDENGEREWADDGIPVFDIPGAEYQNGAGMIGDGNGVIIVGILGDTALYGDTVYVQKIDTNGNLLWGGGVCVSR